MTRVEDTLYIRELNLQVVTGRIVPKEAIHGQWPLDFERAKDFQGHTVPCRAPFEVGVTMGQPHSLTGAVIAASMSGGRTRLAEKCSTASLRAARQWRS
jgi:hypothetical protein